MTKQIKVEINLLYKAVKEAAEEIVARGTVEKEWERALISTIAKLYELLSKPVDGDGEWARDARALQHEMGFFLPFMIEAILAWGSEGKTNVIDEIRRLDACHTGDSGGNSNFNGV